MTYTITASSTRPVAARGTSVVVWTLQAILAAQFAAGGVLKATGDAAMVDMFADIGAGQWLRFLVAGLEIAGAVGLLIPRLAAAAALGLVALLAGASVTNLVILGISPALPLALLVASAVVAWIRRQEIRNLVATVTS